MSRKNAFLFILLLTSTNTHTAPWFNFKQGTIAKCEVIATVALMTCGIQWLEEIYNYKKDQSKSWSETFKDPIFQTGLGLAALFGLAGSWTFNDACSRLNISY